MEFYNEDNVIYMKSGKWALKGSKTGQITKDAGFLGTFNINLIGQLSLESVMHIPGKPFLFEVLIKGTLNLIHRF